MSLLIKNANVISPEGALENTDVLIEKGFISKIDKNIEEKAETVIDASRMTLLPGLVDIHVHLRDPGYEYKEDIYTGTRAAAMGGITSVACMPNTNPVTDNAAVVQYIKNKAKECGVVHVYPIASITKGMNGEEITEVGELKEYGAVAVSDDGRPVMSAALMKKAMQYCKSFDMPVISHCEDIDLVDGGVMNEGKVSTLLGLRGIPSVSEELMVAREILLADYTKSHVHIAHVSSKTSVQLIREAKARGVSITCETAPHYFVLTEEACEGFNTNAKMNPPLKTKEDRVAIIEGLKDDTIDIIATDHAPHHQDEKLCEFNIAANGLVGLETSFALAYTYLVLPGYMTLDKLIRKMAEIPADILKLPAGKIKVGMPADIAIVDLKEEYEVDLDQFASKSRNSPFNGYRLTGKVKHTIVDGRHIMKDGSMIE